MVGLSAGHYDRPSPVPPARPSPAPPPPARSPGASWCVKSSRYHRVTPQSASKEQRQPPAPSPSQRTQSRDACSDLRWPILPRDSHELVWISRLFSPMHEAGPPWPRSRGASMHTPCRPRDMPQRLSAGFWFPSGFPWYVRLSRRPRSGSLGVYGPPTKKFAAK